MKLSTNQKMFFVVILTIATGVIFLGYLSNQSPERISSINNVEKVLKSMDVGDMIIAKSQRTRIALVVTAKFDGNGVKGYVPLYASAVNELLIKDFVNIIGDDGFGTMVVVPEKKVHAAINDMFEIRAMFQK